jgi:RNA polymerase sigma-70 factor, ECF subfamily
LFFSTDKQVEPGPKAGPDADSAPYIEEAARIRALQALDERAWSETYQRHAKAIYSYIYFRIGHQEIAEDLTSDVFVRAMSGIRSYAWRGTPLLAWLYRIAHNVTIDHRKASRRAADHAAPGEPPPDLPDERDDFAAFDGRADMLSAIRCLTEDQQQVLILRFFEGLSTADAARICGKPEGAIKALQARGLRSLKRQLSSEEAAA